jgi:hypothetical protein
LLDNQKVPDHSFPLEDTLLTMEASSTNALACISPEKPLGGQKVPDHCDADENAISEKAGEITSPYSPTELKYMKDNPLWDLEPYTTDTPSFWQGLRVTSTAGEQYAKKPHDPYNEETFANNLNQEVPTKLHDRDIPKADVTIVIKDLSFWDDLSIWEETSKDLRAQVASKSSMIPYTTVGGRTGELFNAILIDHDRQTSHVTINATFFDVGKNIFKQIMVDKNYLFVGGNLKREEKQSNFLASSYEFNFGKKGTFVYSLTDTKVLAGMCCID